MLILSRRPGQKIHIGKDIVIMVTKVEGDKVFVGIEAPREVPIHREELLKRKKEEASEVKVA